MMKLKSIAGGVCAARGFRAAGVPARIKYEGRNDVALIVSDTPCAAAAVFTTNAVAAAPVLYDREVVKVEEERIRSVMEKLFEEYKFIS